MRRRVFDYKLRAPNLGQQLAMLFFHSALDKVQDLSH